MPQGTPVRLNRDFRVDWPEYVRSYTRGRRRSQVLLVLRSPLLLAGCGTAGSRRVPNDARPEDLAAANVQGVVSSSTPNDQLENPGQDRRRGRLPKRVKRTAQDLGEVGGEAGCLYGAAKYSATTERDPLSEDGQSSISYGGARQRLESSGICEKIHVWRQFRIWRNPSGILHWWSSGGSGRPKAQESWRSLKEAIQAVQSKIGRHYG